MTRGPDQKWMSRALEIAERGSGWVNPNPKVGAVIARGEEFISEGFHARVGEAHAEINALNIARAQSKNLNGATLYVTLEPCCHQGRTAPCTNAILDSGINRVVAAVRDPNPKVNGKGFDILKTAGIRIEEGLFAAEAKAQNWLYRHWIKEKKTFVNLKMSVSLDGKISPARKKKGEVFYLIGEEALHRVHHMRQEFDAICVGVKTILQDNPRLNTRLEEVVNPRHPLPVILDSRARTPVKAKIFSERSPLIFVGPQATKAKIKLLEKAGAEVRRVKKNRFGLDLKEVLKILANKEITGLMVEGGSEVAWSFLQQKLVHRLDLVVAPMIIGPSGIPMLSGSSEKGKSRALHLPAYTTERVGEDFWLSGTF